ncbi:MAG: PAS domain-containing protein [Gammaproteobacteria bacterium]|nr:PAS domain-containing protein [Gammaproteobacteria bacterium]MBQ0841099.1 PAS domain-containing protein [Gammaproteobacteria bacterium]
MNSNQTNQLVLDNLNTSVLLIDAELCISYLNPAAESLLAVSAHRLLNSYAPQLFVEAEPRHQVFVNALENESAFTERKVKVLLPDLREITVDYSVTPLAQAGQPLLLLLEMLPVDRTLRIDREEALLSANDTSRNLVRGLAHEIKNPLGGIRGASQLLALELDRSELVEYTDVIIAETDRLRELVDRLLGSPLPTKFAQLNIHEVTEHVATLVQAETHGSLTINKDYDPSIPEITGDREKLIQAVLNVVRNAMQALDGAGKIGHGGEITLRTRILNHFTIGKKRHPMVCRLEIIDNGPGIPADISQRIFYPMISGRAEGSGLGLPIAQSAIHQHQGLIECESELGRTRFSIYLPVKPIKDRLV